MAAPDRTVLQVACQPCGLAFTVQGTPALVDVVATVFCNHHAFLHGVQGAPAIPAQRGAPATESTTGGARVDVDARETVTDRVRP